MTVYPSNCAKCNRSPSMKKVEMVGGTHWEFDCDCRQVYFKGKKKEVIESYNMLQDVLTGKVRLRVEVR
jgi:hypothetical protein